MRSKAITAEGVVPCDLVGDSLHGGDGKRIGLLAEPPELRAAWNRVGILGASMPGMEDSAAVLNAEIREAVAEVDRLGREAQA